MTGKSLEKKLKDELGLSPEGKVSDWHYSQWLEYFRKVPVVKLLGAMTFLQETIPGEGFAAAARWIEIYDSPSKIDRLQKTRLRGERMTGLKELAKSDDQEAFYEALIDENVEQLESGDASPQEVARLTTNIGIFNKNLREIRSRKVKAGSALEKTMKLTAKERKK